MNIKVENKEDFFKYFLLDSIILFVFLILSILFVIEQKKFIIVIAFPIFIYGLLLDNKLRKYMEGVKIMDRLQSFYIIVMTVQILSIKEYKYLFITVGFQLIYMIVNIFVIDKYKDKIKYDK